MATGTCSACGDGGAFSVIVVGDGLSCRGRG